MKKTKKGLTLVEVIVSIAVFTVISLALFSSFLGMRRVSLRQEENVRLEMACYDLKYEWDMYGTDGTNGFSGNGTRYLDSDFKVLPVDRIAEATYKITYTVSDGHLVISSVASMIDDKVFIEDLDCGVSAYGGPG